MVDLILRGLQEVVYITLVLTLLASVANIIVHVVPVSQHCKTTVAHCVLYTTMALGGSFLLWLLVGLIKLATMA